MTSCVCSTIFPRCIAGYVKIRLGLNSFDTKEGNAVTTALLGIIVHLLIEFALIVRVMTRPHRDPASRIAWIAVIAAIPIVGIID